MLNKITPGPWTLLYIVSALLLAFVIWFTFWLSKNPVVPSNPYKVYP